MTEGREVIFVQDLMEDNARVFGDKTCLMFEDEHISYTGFFENSCRAANGLSSQGGKPGDGLAILMENSPAFLYLFYGLPINGFYTVPINVALKGDGLGFIINNSDVKYIAVDESLYPKIEEIQGSLANIEKIFVYKNGGTLPEGAISLDDLFDASHERGSHEIKDGDITYLMYTSGTTGLPKGVVNRQDARMANFMKMIRAMSPDEPEVLYTCLPLFHANALLLTVGRAMGAGQPFALDRKFSASRFWDRIRFYGATTFNGLGAMIPILMKQPERDNDRDNPVKIVHSAACPANLWQAFEKRFDIKLFEGYGAVDGGGVSISNRGDAPVGSVGKPQPTMVWRLVDDDDNDVATGQPGELITKIQEGSGGKVEYYKNAEATEAKMVGGWIRSGDLFYQDEEGYFYFVDRKTDSMRRRGENISSWEVENSIEKHSDVAVCAAFGVPSELGEDEVMIWVVPKDDRTVDLKDLIAFAAENMAYFMVPRFVDIVDDIPRTGTLRVQKTTMKKQGVTTRTWDREKEMPDLKLKKS